MGNSMFRSVRIQVPLLRQLKGGLNSTVSTNRHWTYSMHFQLVKGGLSEDGDVWRGKLGVGGN
jgi:hypothetical protein